MFCLVLYFSSEGIPHGRKLRDICLQHTDRQRLAAASAFNVGSQQVCASLSSEKGDTDFLEA